MKTAQLCQYKAPVSSLKDHDKSSVSKSSPQILGFSAYCTPSVDTPSNAYLKFDLKNKCDHLKYIPHLCFNQCKSVASEFGMSKWKF